MKNLFLKRGRPPKILVLAAILTFALSWLRTDATTITAAQSGNWNDLSTWSGSSIPSSSDDVVIGGGFTVTVDGYASCQSLQLGGGSNDGTLGFYSNAELVVSGGVTLGVASGGSYAGKVTMASGSLLSCGSLAVLGSGTNVWDPGTGTVKITGATTFPSSVITSFYNLIIDPGATNTVSLGTGIFVSSTVSLYTGTLDLSGQALTVDLNTLIECKDGVLLANGGGVSHAGSYYVSYSPQTANYQTGAELNGTDFKDITIDAGSYTVTLNSAAAIETGYKLDLVSGTFASGSNLTMDVSSSIYRESGAMTGSIQGTNNYTIVYNGNSVTSGAELSGAGFKSVTLSMSSASQVLTLSSDLTIAGILSMNTGDINLNGHTLSIGTSTSSIGTLAYSSGGIIQNGGTFSRWFDNSTLSYVTGTFPLKVGMYDRRFSIKGTPSSGGMISVSATDASTNTSFAYSFTENGITFSQRNDSRWSIVTSNGFAGNMSVQMIGNGIYGIIDATKLTISGATGAASGTYAPSSGSSAVPVVERTNLALGGDLYIAGSMMSPLPVSLISFEVEKSADNIILDWTTASEINNAGFEIQQSADGNSWQDAAWMEGYGTTQIQHTYHYALPDTYSGAILYFRLKQLDYNGSVHYSPVRSIRNTGDISSANGRLKIYPNPSSSIISIAETTSPIVNIEVMDMSGNRVLRGNERVIDVSILPPGTYIINVQTQTEKLAAYFLRQN